MNGPVRPCDIMPAGPALAPRRVTPDASRRRAPPGDRFDALVLAIAADGDRQAFTTLFEVFAPRLKGMLMRQGLGSAAAEEVVQDTMLAVWRKAGMFDPDKASAATWIFTIARNLRIDLQRRSRPAAGEPDPSDIPDAMPPADEAAIAAEAHSLVRRALGRLSPEQMRIVELSFFADEPHAQIARALSIPLGTVKSRVRLALARLRSLLSEDP